MTQPKNDLLFRQGELELTRAKGHFEDLDCRLQRAFAVQYLLDIREDDEGGKLDLLGTVNKMIEELTLYRDALSDPSSDEYDGLLETHYYDVAEGHFCREILDQESFATH